MEILKISRHKIVNFKNFPPTFNTNYIHVSKYHKFFHNFHRGEVKWEQIEFDNSTRSLERDSKVFQGEEKNGDEWKYFCKMFLVLPFEERWIKFEIFLARCWEEDGKSFLNVLLRGVILRSLVVSSDLLQFFT